MESHPASITDTISESKLSEIVETFVKSRASENQSQKDECYGRVISYVDESEALWLNLEGSQYQEIQSNLLRTTLFLVDELNPFDVELIRKFSLVTLRVCNKSQSRDELSKAAAWNICSALFSKGDESIIEVLKCVLDFMADECKDTLENTRTFLELVCSCANKCKSVTVGLCKPIAEHLNQLACRFSEKDFPSISSIMRLYISGLLAIPSNQPKGKDIEKDENAPIESGLQVLLANKKRSQEVAATIELLKVQKGSFCPLRWEALKFVYQSLAESVIFNMKELFSVAGSASWTDDLGRLYDEFNKFRLIFLERFSDTERDTETSVNNHIVISCVVLTELVLSFKTKKNIEESILSVEHVISVPLVPVKRLKFLYHNLKKIAIILNKEERLKEATNVLKLSYKASCKSVEEELYMETNQEHTSEDNENIPYMWYELMDFLLIKGDLRLHHKLYDFVIKSFDKKKLEKGVAELWKNKRLSHALCASPVNDIFLDTFSKHHNELCKSPEFWNACLDELKPLVVGFQKSNEIKQSAVEVISTGSQTSSSNFLLSNLYYDLSGELISSGQMIEALTYAKKAHGLRFTLKEEFQFFSVTDFEVKKDSGDPHGCVLTPWNVLSCYLESTLQLGYIYEILGDACEAEEHLKWGRGVAQYQGLPRFEIYFSCALGKIYRKQKLWEAAKEELSNAKGILKKNLDNISCKKCLCIFEVTISQQLGDLLSSSKESDAKSYYNLALDKLNPCDWRASYSIFESDDFQAGPSSEHLSIAADRPDHVVTESISYADFQSGVRSLCNSMKCLQCSHSDCSNLNSFMCMKWVFVHRKICLRLLISIGKFLGTYGVVNEGYETLLQIRNSFCSKHSSESLGDLFKTIGKQFPGPTVLAAERATLLYYFCWFTVKKYQRTSELPSIETTEIVTILKLSFILSRDIPLLFQKISRLLAIVYVLSTSLEQISLPTNEKECESMYASFYHQASISTVLNQQFISATVQKKQSQNSEGSSLSNPELPSYPRPEPESCELLHEFVQKFFKCLPSSATICISFVSGVDAGLLNGFFEDCSPEAKAWILLSHLSSGAQHVILIPVFHIFEDDKANSSFYGSGDAAELNCPWISSVIDDIAPVFRQAMEEYCFFQQHTRVFDAHQSELKFDASLRLFLQGMEDFWLGTWKYLLLGIWPKDEEDCVASKQCYVGKSSNDLNLERKKSDKPIILVLDIDVQMLPWESLPILRYKEVYRMPSVGSIFTTYAKYSENPSIYPLDTCYLLNPDLDPNIRDVVADFNAWLQARNIQGMIEKFTVEKLSQQLKKHDLFIYAGHGDGTQVISLKEIEKVEGCAAALILGCSGACFKLKGSYMPEGAPISYLLAGSPFVVANLWNINADDICKFGKKLLGLWIDNRSPKACGPRIGSFMGKARLACKDPYIVGAAPVCYGIPTGILSVSSKPSKKRRRKNNTRG